jgi:hypothetical protein
MNEFDKKVQQELDEMEAKERKEKEDCVIQEMNKKKRNVFRSVLSFFKK